jgi:hypothetical protein
MKSPIFCLVALIQLSCSIRTNLEFFPWDESLCKEWLHRPKVRNPWLSWCISSSTIRRWSSRSISEWISIWTNARHTLSTSTVFCKPSRMRFIIAKRNPVSKATNNVCCLGRKVGACAHRSALPSCQWILDLIGSLQLAVWKRFMAIKRKDQCSCWACRVSCVSSLPILSHFI